MRLVGISVDVGIYLGEKRLDGPDKGIIKVKIQTQKGDLHLIVTYNNFGRLICSNGTTIEFQNIETRDKVAFAYTTHLDADNKQVLFLEDIKRIV